MTTRLSLRALRADALHCLLLSGRGDGVGTLDEVRQLADLRGWAHASIDLAIDDLVADGRIVDDPAGRLLVSRAGAQRAA